MRQPLLEPYMLGDLQLRNRVVMAPLTRTRADNPGHVPTDLMRQYYEQRATAGLIISEGVWVSESIYGKSTALLRREWLRLLPVSTA